MLETSRRRLVPCLIVTCTIIATLGLGSTTVAARTIDIGRIRYRDTGFDPDDRPKGDDCCQRDPDIQSSTRTVSVDQEGHWLLVKFRTYDYLLGYWAVRVYFDVRGGPSRDRRMRLRDTGTGQAPARGRQAARFRCDLGGRGYAESTAPLRPSTALGAESHSGGSTRQSESAGSSSRRRAAHLGTRSMSTRRITGGTYRRCSGGASRRRGFGDAPDDGPPARC
jgi:hypothetical protein